MIKLIADSSCDIVDIMTCNNDRYTFTSIPVTITLDGVDHVDDGTLNPQEYIDNLKKCKNTPKTSAPSPEKFLNAFEENIQDDDETIYVFCMSSKISATYNSATLAKTMFNEKYPSSNKKIFIYDTLAASAAVTSTVIQTIDLINSGTPSGEIYIAIEKFINHSLNFYIVLERYNILVKNGRVKPYIAKIATLLNIRPICKSADGLISLISKPHASKTYKNLVNMIANSDTDFSNRTLVITHVQCLDRAEYIKNKLLTLVNFKDIIIANPTCLCITQGDIGGILIGY